METDKRFNLFYDALKDEYKSYVEDVVKSLGFLIVAIGWIMTSEGARSYLASPRVNGFALACTLLLAACNFAVYIGHYLRSARLKKQLLLQDPEASELVANYALSPLHIAINSVTIAGLFVFLAVQVVALEK
ncbi:hypothetical protein [Zoogloea sp.]|uniref:hypothetical protein n=1 Tax=Zoogloea sp. TaxID=49181 RepID=UPI0035B4F192